MFDLIDKHDPIRDCDCPYCAIVERNRLQALIKSAPVAEIWESSLGVNGKARYLRVDPSFRVKAGQRVALVKVDNDPTGEHADSMEEWARRKVKE